MIYHSEIDTSGDFNGNSWLLTILIIITVLCSQRTYNLRKELFKVACLEKVVGRKSWCLDSLVARNPLSLVGIGLWATHQSSQGRKSTLSDLGPWLEEDYREQKDLLLKWRGEPTHQKREMKTTGRKKGRGTKLQCKSCCFTFHVLGFNFQMKAANFIRGASFLNHSCYLHRDEWARIFYL